MTTKTISGTYAAAFELKSPFSALKVAAGGDVEGDASYGVFTPAGASGAYSIHNAGTITGGRFGVLLTDGGTLTNAAGGVVEGYLGVKMTGGRGTVANDGQIEGTGASTDPAIVYLTDGGLITNGAVGATAAQIEGFRAVKIVGGAGTVDNFATIDGMVRSGIILLEGGSVTNGSLADTGALIEGGTAGVAVGGAAATVTNFGAIGGLVQILRGGVVVNGAPSDTTASISNANPGLGAVGFYKIAGTVTNFGVIQSTTIADGVYLDAGVVTNGSTAVTGASIQGEVGVDLAGVGVITNFGAIDGDGGVAVQFGSASDLLIAEAGSRFVGAIVGGHGKLELAGGTGTISGLGGSATLTGAVTAAFSGFSSYAVEAGAWTLTSGDTIASGTSLTSQGALAASGTLTDAGTLSLLGGGGALAITGSLVDSGALNLIGDASVTIGAAGVTLSGRGAVNGDNIAGAVVTGATSGATLTNADVRIDLTGQLGDGSMVLVNQASGVINNIRAAGLIIDTGAATIRNAGTIAATAPGGGVDVQSALHNTGELLAGAGGTLTLDGAVFGTGFCKINGGVIDATTAAGFEQNVLFTAGGTLELADSRAFAGTISGFSTSGATSLDLVDIAFMSGTTTATYAGTTASGVLTVTSGADVAAIHFTGDYLTATWTLASDDHGGTTVVDPKAGAAKIAGFVQATASLGAGPAAIGSDPESLRPATPVLVTPRAFVALH